MLDIHVWLNLGTEGALVMLGMHRVTIKGLVSCVKQASGCPNDVVCVYGWRVIDREVASIEDSPDFKYLHVHSRKIVIYLCTFIQVEKLQNLSYKINPVIKNCQILSRTKRWGMERGAHLSHVIK